MDEFLKENENNQCLLDTVPISDDLHKQIVSELNNATRRKSNSDRRAEPRYRVEHADLVLLEIFDSNGSKSAYQVKPRNISRSGIAFLHGQDVHIGALCRLTVVCSDESTLEVEGRVVRSKNVLGSVFEIGVQFDDRIDLDGVVDDTASPQDRRQA
jgi:hypothetical protein